MKFRDKETGEIEEVYLAMSGDRIAVIVADMPLCGNSVLGEYDSLAELTDKWEDYKPIEPLIKDENVRETVRAWAKALGLQEVYCASNGYEIYGGIGDYVIQFNGEPFPFADKNKIYTIAELCGEEEAPEPIEPTFIDLDERIKEKEGK